MSCWMSPEYIPSFNKMKVVFPVCEKDLDLMLDNLDWQTELDGRKDWDCLLSVDGSITDQRISELESYAWRAFADVDLLVYPASPNVKWPNGPNWAFQQTAKYLEPFGRSWFWMEPDCIPLRPLWLETWNSEYISCGKPIMGAIVDGMGHCNGTAVYPNNLPTLIPETMTCTNIAWDGLLARTNAKLIHDASKLLCHVWGVTNDKAQPFGGQPAVFTNWDQVRRWVKSGAVLFHRAKNVSLINQLRNRRRGHENSNPHSHIR